MARALGVDVFGYLDYRAFLRDAYADLKQTQRGFSFRWFSRRAGLSSPNFLKLVMEGKRNLTSDTARRFAKALGLTPRESDFFGELVGFDQARTPEEKNLHYERTGAYKRHRTVRALERHQFEYLSRWYYAAIRELVACAGFREDPEWIASRLVPPITPAQVRQTLDLLLTIGFLERDEDGTLRQRDPLLSTGPEVRSLAAGNFHRQMMERAAAAIDLVERDLRDISGVTVSLTPETFKMFKEKIIKLRAELLELSAGETRPTRVVQFNFQIFPLAVVEENEP